MNDVTSMLQAKQVVKHGKERDPVEDGTVEVEAAAPAAELLDGQDVKQQRSVGWGTCGSYKCNNEECGALNTNAGQVVDAANTNMDKDDQPIKFGIQDMEYYRSKDKQVLPKLDKSDKLALSKDPSSRPNNGDGTIAEEWEFLCKASKCCYEEYRTSWWKDGQDFQRYRNHQELLPAVTSFLRAAKEDVPGKTDAGVCNSCVDTTNFELGRTYHHVDMTYAVN